MDLPNIGKTLARIDAKLARMENPRAKRMLAAWRKHYHSEAIGDLDTTMATMPPDPYYRFYGTNVFGVMEPINSADAARAMYQSMLDAGLLAAAPFEDERWAFDDDILMLEATFTGLFPGAGLINYDPSLSPDALYLVRWKMATIHPYDEQDRMLAEIIYSSAPLSVVPAQPGDRQKLLEGA